MRHRHAVLAAAAFWLLCILGRDRGWTAERDPLAPRVPPEQRVAARALKNPYRPTPANLAAGKLIFETKGSCMVCHGPTGEGDGLAAVGLDPSPRNFTNRAFHQARRDGELMWVLKNGSPGTAMMPLVGAAITEDEGWLVLLYERSLAKP